MNHNIVVNAQNVSNVEINPQNYIGYGCNNGEDLKENINGNEINAIPESLTGFGCSSSCGASRENGYSSAYESGCRNWQIMPIISPLYKYWIDESSLTSLTDAQRKTFIMNVDNAVKEWNSVRLSDYDGAIVNLLKCLDNGLDVVPIRYYPSLSGALGQFNPVPLFHEIRIKEFNDYNTIMHEFGHMIGLQDLDMNNNPWTHISLMGYAGDYDLHYQDMQGHAVASGSYNSGQRYATCLLCVGLAEMGFVQITINSSAVTKVTIKGSFILVNGVIVLEDEDLDAYLNGTLVFYDKDKVPVLQ